MNPSVARTTLIRRGSRPRPPATGSSQEGAFAAEVTVRVTVFRSADDSFGIVAAASAAGDELTLVGDDIAALEPGVRAFVRGTWEKHRRYGRQVRVREVRPLEPQGAAGARGFLCSLPHIGPARAAQLVERFGEETFAQLDADPEGASSTSPAWVPHAPSRPLVRGPSEPSTRFSPHTG